MPISPNQFGAVVEDSEQGPRIRLLRPVERPYSANSTFRVSDCPKTKVPFSGPSVRAVRFVAAGQFCNAPNARASALLAIGESGGRFQSNPLTASLIMAPLKDVDVTDEVIMRKLAIAAAAFFLVNPSALAQDKGAGRFQMVGSPVVIMDTSTGQLWIASGNAPEYYMRQICYRGPNGQLMPTPYENMLTDDLAQFQALCSSQIDLQF